MQRSVFIPMNEIINELAKQLKETRQQKADLKKQATALEAQIDEAEFKLVQAMTAEGLQSVKLDGLGNVIRVQEQIAKCTDKPALFEYLKTEGLFDDLVTETIGFRKLNDLNASKLIADGVDLPGCESILLEKITIRKI